MGGVTDPGTLRGVGPLHSTFIRRLYAAFDGSGLSPEARQIAVAQACFESGYGQSRVARLGHNYWNLTRIKSDTRPIIEGGDTEYDEQGRVKPIRQRFRAYTSDAEGIADYLHFLSVNDRYKAAYAALLAGNCPEYVRRLREDDPATPEPEGGFFTLPLAQYQSVMAGCLAIVRSVLSDPPAVAANEAGKEPPHV